MIIIDTSVWVDYLRGISNPHTMWLYNNLDRQPLGLTPLILCEVLQGLSAREEEGEVLQELSAFRIFAAHSTENAIASARNYRLLRARGITVRKTIDRLIGTFCIEENHVLLHRDRDFDHFEKHLGLQVLHPPENDLQTQ